MFPKMYISIIQYKDIYFPILLIKILKMIMSAGFMLSLRRLTIIP